MRRGEGGVCDPSWRADALRLCAALGGTPAVRRRLAAAVGVSDRTMRRWAQRAASGEPLVRPRGRRSTPVARETRQALIGTMRKLGPCAGVAVLRALFRDVPYRVFAWLKRRFVRVLQRRKGWFRKKLDWRRPGAVWAMDFTHPEAQLPHGWDRLFLVRDLGSGAQLAAVPCRGERALPAILVLAALFARFGPPIVIKHDGGGAFVAHATQALLHAYGVFPLRSPPYFPQYNGACERAGGTLKRRIAHLARLAGHPGVWTVGDILEALWLANTTARPRGANGPTPAEALRARRRVRTRERRAFRKARARAIARALQTHEANTGRMPTCAERAAILRHATQHALCAHGYLAMRRGRISTPVLTWTADIKA